jgi:hypothetical protein
MKHTIFLSFFVLFLFQSCQAQSDRSKTMATNENAAKIEVLDFHTTHRCQTCLKIEDNTTKLLNESFKDEMEKGLITFKTVNIDEEENYELAERFEAAGTSLFLNVIKDGKEHHIDLTNFAFMKAFDEEEFASELKQKIEEQLKSL